MAVYQEAVYTATYTATTRTYTVTWQTRGASYSQVVEYGGNATVDESYFNLEPYKDTAYNQYYVFKG